MLQGTSEIGIPLAYRNMLRRGCIKLCEMMNAMCGYVIFVAAALWVTYGASTGH